MSQIEWTSALSVGIPSIDDQHRVLVDLINRLGEVATEGKPRSEIGPVLLELEDYARKHFALEELAFERYGYPGSAGHIAEHEAFIARVDEFQLAFAVDKAEVGEEILLFLRTWLTRHIAFSDKKYRPYLQGHI